MSGMTLLKHLKTGNLVILQLGLSQHLAGSFGHNFYYFFDTREVMIRAVPAFDEPYIKVPKVLNKD